MCARVQLPKVTMLPCLSTVVQGVPGRVPQEELGKSHQVQDHHGMGVAKGMHIHVWCTWSWVISASTERHHSAGHTPPLAVCRVLSIQQIAYQVLEGLAYLNQHRLVHSPQPMQRMSSGSKYCKHIKSFKAIKMATDTALLHGTEAHTYAPGWTYEVFLCTVSKFTSSYQCV